MKETLKKLIESTNIPASLVRAVVRQMGGWQSFCDSAPYIIRHGIDGGFCGFITYSDTESFAKRNRSAIAEMAQDQASDFCKSPIELIQQFQCFHENVPSTTAVGEALYAGRNYEDEPNILNALAWYAGEEVARAYCDAFNPQ